MMRGTALACLLLVAAPSAAYGDCDEAQRERDRVELLRILEGLKTANAKYTDGWFRYADRADGTHTGEERPQEAFDRLKSAVDQVQCRPDQIPEISKVVAGVAKKVEAGRQKEAMCRQTASCLTRRRALAFAPEVCEALNMKELIRAAIAEERANPAGVVDLRKLHELGHDLQLNDQQLREAKSEFVAKAKIPFESKMCAELAVDADGNYIRPVMLDSK